MLEQHAELGFEITFLLEADCIAQPFFIGKQWVKLRVWAK